MLQLSGLHTHANEHGYVGAPETAYSHVHTTDHGHQPEQSDSDHVHELSLGSADHVHDYEDARDLSVFELASGKLKLSLAILAPAFLLCVSSGFPALLNPHFAYRVLSGRHTRWRPPLRAPPA
jgi:hypothetical protein